MCLASYLERRSSTRYSSTTSVKRQISTTRKRLNLFWTPYQSQLQHISLQTYPTSSPHSQYATSGYPKVLPQVQKLSREVLIVSNTLEKVASDKIKIQKWDRKWVLYLHHPLKARWLSLFFRKPVAILDQNHKIVCVLAGQPEDNSWMAGGEALGFLLEKVSRRFNQQGQKDKERNWGHFLTNQVGLTLGSGGRNITHVCTAKALEEILDHPGALRAKCFAEGIFFPNLFGFIGWLPKTSLSQELFHC